MLYIFYPKPHIVSISQCQWLSEISVIVRDHKLDNRELAPAGTLKTFCSQPGRFLAPPSLLSRGYFGEKDMKPVVPLCPCMAWCSTW
jgi:hypothetical protein